MVRAADQFDDVFPRYLENGAFKQSQASQCNQSNGLSRFSEPSQDPNVTDRRSDLSTRKDGDVTAATDSNSDLEGWEDI